VRVAAFQIPSSKWWENGTKPANVVYIKSVQHLVDEMVSEQLSSGFGCMRGDGRRLTMRRGAALPCAELLGTL
jgi:hypothetical protein